MTTVYVLTEKKDKVLYIFSVTQTAGKDYFSDKNDKFSVLPTKEIRNKIIPRLDINEAAKMLGMNHNTVRKGLQQGVFPWGYGIRTSENRWVYFINAKRFAEIEGIVF